MSLVLLSYPFFLLLIWHFDCHRWVALSVVVAVRRRFTTFHLYFHFLISILNACSFQFVGKLLPQPSFVVVIVVVVTVGCCCPSGRVVATKRIPMNVEQPPPETPQSVAIGNVQRATNGQQCQCHCQRGARLVLLLYPLPRPPTHCTLCQGWLPMSPVSRCCRTAYRALQIWKRQLRKKLDTTYAANSKPTSKQL